MMIAFLALWVAIIGTILGFLLYIATSFYPFLALGLVLEVAFLGGYLDHRLKELSNTFSSISEADKFKTGNRTRQKK